MDLVGDLRVAFGTQAPSSERARLRLPIADTVRLSAALPVTRWLTLRPTFEWALWSVLKEHVFARLRRHAAVGRCRGSFHDMFAGRLRADARL